jgi:lipopolysaccharide transport system ATP-binding protein
MSVLTIHNLGKAYKQYSNRWARLAEWFIPVGNPRHHLHWVLEGINFSLEPGEALGIVGINGAGKSTLLKMIAGTVQPTKGTIQVKGRLAALLELGMGFHPDFSGRQNALMAAQLLGYSPDEIAQLMPEIEAFAEIGEYIDQPVRVYSSGMQMRLAFSVATAIRPDILVIDEALSVGDAYFQHKSFDRIRQFQIQGSTLLIVSHDKAAIQSICSRAILINGGRLTYEGKPEEVMNYYNALLADKVNHEIEFSQTNTGETQIISGSGEASIVAVRLLDQQGDLIEVFDVGQSAVLQVEVRANKDLPELVLGYVIKDRLGQAIFGTNTHQLKQVLYNVKKDSAFIFDFCFVANLGEGSYSISIALHSDNTHISNNYEWRELAALFSVVNMKNLAFLGSSWIPPTLEIKKIL